jgi:hypothetical protein
MEPIIKVEHLSKRYQIGARLKSYATLRETIAGTARASLKSCAATTHRAKRTKRCGRFVT